MSSFNKALLMGNLTRDPQLKFLPSQAAVVEFGIAVNRKYKTANGESREEVTFVDVAFFGKVAEVINQYFKKGDSIFIEGRLKYDSWEDKQGGKRQKISVVGENFQFVGGKREGGEQESRPPARNLRKEVAGRAPAEQPFGDEREFHDPDQEVPF